MEQPSAAEAERPPENREAGPRPSAPLIGIGNDYIEASIAAEVRQLRAANPNRSLKWIAKQSGQPPSAVREILGNGEDGR